jgi:DNA-binding MarR family transcriptional regulator
LLKPAEKRAVDLLADWPWLSPRHLGSLLGVKRSRLSQVTQRLAEFGLLVDVAGDGDRDRRLALSDRGLVMLARRDRTSVGDARKRWSAKILNANAPLHWRNVAGTRTRQLLRNVEHTAAVHAFVAALCRQARSRSREILQLDPPRRASLYFRHQGKLRSVHPDAFGVIRRSNDVWPFFLEWERRAVRPATMAARIAPYLRYYATPRPTDDHGAQPLVLVVFDDPIALTHFLEVAAREMERARVRVPLLASHRELVKTVGPLGTSLDCP